MQKNNGYRQRALAAIGTLFMALLVTGCPAEKEVANTHANTNANDKTASMITIEKAMLGNRAPIDVVVGEIIQINQGEPKWRIYLGRKDEQAAVITKDDKGFQQSLKFVKTGTFVVNTTSVISKKSAGVQPAPNVQKQQITFVVH